jgi:hypothetical protein
VVIPPGFGDFLRGCVFLHQQSKNKFKFIVDFSKHPLGKYIVPHHNTILDETIHPTEYFNEEHEKLDNLLKTLGDSDKYLITSHFYNICMGDDDKKFMKKVLTFTDNFNKNCDSITAKIGIENYFVLHIRMGDPICNDDVNPPVCIKNFVEQYVIPNKINILVVSDSYSVKKKLGDLYGVKYIDSVPAHMGACSQIFKYNEPRPLADDETIENVLADFVLMSKSRGIFYWSVYNGPSGFSKMCSEIYDIKLMGL